MKVLIIEDEAPAARSLEKALKALAQDIQVVGSAESVEEAVILISSNPDSDLIFMDIELADGRSFDIFQNITVHCPVIFTTAYDRFALEAFKVNSVDYLLKPVQEEELKHAIAKYRLYFAEKKEPIATLDINKIIQKIQEGKPEYKSRFLVKTGQRMIPLGIDEIAYFKSEDKLGFIYTFQNVRYAIDHTLDELEKLLEPTRFYRANRQYIISIDSLENVHNFFNGKLKLDLKPRPKEDVLVSREKATDFKGWIDN